MKNKILQTQLSIVLQRNIRFDFLYLQNNGRINNLSARASWNSWSKQMNFIDQKSRHKFHAKNHLENRQHFRIYFFYAKAGEHLHRLLLIQLLFFFSSAHTVDNFLFGFDWDLLQFWMRFRLDELKADERWTLFRISEWAYELKFRKFCIVCLQFYT